MVKGGYILAVSNHWFYNSTINRHNYMKLLLLFTNFILCVVCSRTLYALGEGGISIMLAFFAIGFLSGFILLLIKKAEE
jgi:hypothetical protein